MKASKNILLRNRQKLHAKEVYFTYNRKITYSKCIYTRNFSISNGTDNDRLKENYCFPRERNHNSSVNKCTFTKVYRKKALKEQSTLTLAKVICHLSFPCVIRYILSHHQLSLEIDAATIQILLQFLRVSKLLLKSIEL